MLRALLDFFISIVDCCHAHSTFPRTVKDKTGKAIYPVRYYIVCLDCARTFDYAWPPGDQQEYGARRIDVLACRIDQE